MKRLLATVLFIFLLGLGMGMYYINLDNYYNFVEEFSNFPVPKNAKLESENEIAKHYKWNLPKQQAYHLVIV